MAQPTVPRSRELLVAMKAEATYGTDIFAGTYVAADVLPAFNITPTLALEEIENLATSGQLGRLTSIIGREQGGVQFSIRSRGRGVAYAAGTRPEIDLPMQGCGHSSTVVTTVGLESVTYAPTSTHASMTIYIHQKNGPSIQLVGCFGSVEFVPTPAGQPMEARFSFQGLIDAVADITYTPGTLAATPQFPTLKSAAFQIDTANYAPRIASAGFNVGNVLQPLPAINSTGGLAGFFIADRNPRLLIDPEADLVANYAWFSKWLSQNLADVTYQLGTAQYNRAKFSFSKAQIASQAWAARDGLTAFNTQLLAVLTAGNDDYSLVFD